MKLLWNIDLKKSKRLYQSDVKSTMQFIQQRKVIRFCELTSVIGRRGNDETLKINYDFLFLVALHNALQSLAAEIN